MQRQRSGYVAIVDDDASMRGALARQLRMHGVNSRSYPSAFVFLEGLASGMPDCLIVDVQMPQMTGIELQRELLNRDVHIPTIVITANDDKGIAASAGSLGAAAFFLKPVQHDALMAAINLATTEQRTQRPDNCNRSGVAIDWLDACRSGKLDVLLNLYDEQATLKCDCDGVNLAGRNSLATYWNSKLEGMAAAAFALRGMILTGDEIQVECKSCKGKPIHIHLRFSRLGKILHTRFAPLPLPI